MMAEPRGPMAAPSIALLRKAAIDHNRDRRLLAIVPGHVFHLPHAGWINHARTRIRRLDRYFPANPSRKIGCGLFAAIDNNVSGAACVTEYEIVE